MDDNAKQASSYQLDQEILDARGIDMTVSEVAGLPTARYGERVAALRLRADDLAFLKGLRRRIKNRLASQNSRRRSVEHLRKLAGELRAAKACRYDMLSERRELVAARGVLRAGCRRLRGHIAQVLKERCDPTDIPPIDERISESPPNEIEIKKIQPPNQNYQEKERNITEFTENKISIRLEKLVQQSVSHIFAEKKRVVAKTVFIKNEFNDDEKALNLCVKRRSHGRKQSAPRRIAYECRDDDGVLDLKIKKEPQ